MNYETRHCAHCGTALQPITLAEDGGDKERLRCPACGWTHWNNPTPVLAAIVEVGGKVLLARNAAWPGKMFALITGFMEAGESPQEGIAREVKEETNLDVRSATLVGAYEFLRMNQVIIAYHVVAEGEVRCRPSWWTTGCTICQTSSAGLLAQAMRWPTGCARGGTSRCFLPTKKMQNGAAG
jgi:NAD+ diphosphatase